MIHRIASIASHRIHPSIHIGRSGGRPMWWKPGPWHGCRVGHPCRVVASIAEPAIIHLPLRLDGGCCCLLGYLGARAPRALGCSALRLAPLQDCRPANAGTAPCHSSAHSAGAVRDEGCVADGRHTRGPQLKPQPDPRAAADAVRGVCLDRTARESAHGFVDGAALAHAHA